MLRNHALKSLIMAVMLVIQAQAALAANVMTVCPSPDMLKNFQGEYVESRPISYDQAHGQMLMSVVQSKNFPEQDPMWGGYGRVLFIISGVADHPGQSWRKMTAAQVAQLQLESETPSTYQDSTDLSMPVCAYSVPGQSINAVIIQVPNEKIATAIV